MASEGAQSKRPEVTPEAIRAQLDRVLASRYFIRSDRLTRFLRFSVEHALNGTSEQVKEYLVGVEVFDRSRDYDPRVDPIVRVEARRLRAKLKSFYATTGRTDYLIIEFPKGAYTPAFRLRELTESKKEDERGIAVLPFTNLSGEDDYFSDGLTEELIHRLTRTPGLRVVAWHSVSQMRGREQDFRGVAEQLKVNRVLRGSVRRTTSRVRVTAQLVDALTGSYVWSESFERDTADVLSIQDDIARAIVDTLQPAPAARPARAVRPNVANFESYNLYLQGRFHSNKRTERGLRAALNCFEEAILLDPDSPLPLVGIADALSLLTDYGIMHPSEVMPKARRSAERALELDPASAEAHASMALIVSLYDWKWTEAETLYRRAIELNPGYATAHHWFAVDFLNVRGRMPEAAVEIETALRLDPLSLIIHEGVAYVHMFERRYEAALDAYRQLLVLEPTFYKAYSSMGRALTMLGRYDEANEFFEKARSLAGEIPNIIAALGHGQAMAGRKDEARSRLRELHDIARTGYVPSTCFALVHMGLGEMDRSVEWLQCGCENHEFPIVAIGHHPVYDPLRNRADFRQLLAKIGF